MATVGWEPEFEFKKAFSVNAKKPYSGEPTLISVYYHNDAGTDCFYCYADKFYSHAKLLLKKSPANKHSLGHIWICSMNNTEKKMSRLLNYY